MAGPSPGNLRTDQAAVGLPGHEEPCLFSAENRDVDFAMRSGCFLAKVSTVQLGNSTHAETGVDRQGHPGDPLGLVRDEESHGIGDVLWLEDVDGHCVLHRRN